MWGQGWVMAGVDRVMTKVLAGMCGECHLLPGVDLGLSPQINTTPPTTLPDA